MGWGGVGNRGVGGGRGVGVVSAKKPGTRQRINKERGEAGIGNWVHNNNQQSLRL